MNAAPLRPVLAGALVFFASGSVLVLEVVGLRLVAPYVGISLQSSSAVIGMSLAAIALGAWTGGRLADHVGPRRLLPTTFVVAGIVTGLTLPVVRVAGPQLQGDNPVSITALAFMAVFAPCVFMASVTPMVVKLQLQDLGQTGTIVGRLSGLGTLGGIIATFVTGFVLLAALPTTLIVVALAAMSLLVGLALGLRLKRWSKVPVALLLASLVSVAAPPLTHSPCTVETAYHCARVAADPARASGRFLILDNLFHSYVDLADPTHLEFPYVQVIASVADEMRPAGQPISALHIGAGGLTLPRYLAATRPGSLSRVLEIDGGVIALDRTQLGLDPMPGLTIDIGDARAHLHGELDQSRDLVIGDAFGGLAVPWHLTTREVVAEIARILRPDGVYAVNVIDFPPNRFIQAEVATIASVFPQVVLVAPASALAGRAGGNFVIVASARSLPLAALRQRLSERGTGDDVADLQRTVAFASGASVLTDDHAPVDQLITRPT